MSVEDALKLVLSLGVVVPEWHPLHPFKARLRAPNVPRNIAASFSSFRLSLSIG